MKRWLRARLRRAEVSKRKKAAKSREMAKSGIEVRDPSESVVKLAGEVGGPGMGVAKGNNAVTKIEDPLL